MRLCLIYPIKIFIRSLLYNVISQIWEIFWNITDRLSIFLIGWELNYWIECWIECWIFRLLELVLRRDWTNYEILYYARIPISSSNRHNVKFMRIEEYEEYSILPYITCDFSYCHLIIKYLLTGLKTLKTLPWRYPYNIYRNTIELRIQYIYEQ